MHEGGTDRGVDPVVDGRVTRPELLIRSEGHLPVLTLVVQGACLCLGQCCGSTRLLRALLSLLLSCRTVLRRHWRHLGCVVRLKTFPVFTEQVNIYEVEFGLIGGNWWRHELLGSIRVDIRPYFVGNGRTLKCLESTLPVMARAQGNADFLDRRRHDDVDPKFGGRGICNERSQ